MNNNIIDRFEQKYFISNGQYNDLLGKINNELERDEYYKETIYNVYFDNDNFELINRSIDKPIYKEKIRLRSYEVITDDSNVFLEIKKKYNNNSNKRRVSVKYVDLINYLDNGIIPNTNMQIMKEIDYYFRYYNLKPKINIKYDRLSYCLSSDKSFRITFDNNVIYNIENKKDNLLFKEGYIMEIKTLKGIPLWLNKVFNELNILPTSYSKVGKIFENIKESDVYV